MSIEIGAEQAGERIDKLVARLPGLGRAQARRLFASGAVRLMDGGRSVVPLKGQVARAGQRLEVRLDEVGAVPNPSASLVVVVEAPRLVVVDKPAGVPSAPLAPGEIGSVANALLARYPEMVGVGYSPREPGLCHRLDTGTSGLLLAARDARAFDLLTRAIRDGSLDKRYLAVCHDRNQRLAPSGRVEAPLAHEGPRVRVDDRGTPVSTTYRMLRRAGPYALCELRAAAAFRHQVRAHMASLGCPLVGDTLYGAPPHPIGRHALHASHLSLEGKLAFEATSPLPADLGQLVGG